MSIYEETNFNLNKNLLMCIGCWPYAGTSKKAVRSFLMALMTVLAVPHLVGAIIHHANTDRMMLSIVFFITVITMMLKILGLTIAESNMMNLYENLENNWSVTNDSREKEILIEYAKKVSIAIVSVTLIISPAAPKILDLVIPLSTTGSHILIGQGEFFIDRETHFVVIYFVDCITVATVALVTVSVDTIYVHFSLQSCALYAIVSCRLRAFDISSAKTEKSDYCEWFIQIILLHRLALNFTSMIDRAFSKFFMYILTTTFIVIPLNACAVLANLNNTYNLLTYATFLVASTLHVFILFWPGQQIINHASNLRDDVYFSEWHTKPVHAKKLLVIFMLRCSKTTSLTAGGWLLINFETYSKIMRTAVSYFTVLASLRY